MPGSWLFVPVNEFPMSSNRLCTNPMGWLAHNNNLFNFPQLSKLVRPHLASTSLRPFTCAKQPLLGPKLKLCLVSSVTCQLNVSLICSETKHCPKSNAVKAQGYYHPAERHCEFQGQPPGGGAAFGGLPRSLAPSSLSFQGRQPEAEGMHGVCVCVQA